MKRFGVILFVAGVFLAAAFPVSAGTVRVAPILSVEQEYSDNILFSSNFEEEDFITTISGGVEIQQKTERINAGLYAHLDQLLYWEFDKLNSLDKFFSGDVKYKTTEQLNLGATALYSQDSRRDRDTDTTGLLITGDRETARVSFLSDYLFSETTKGEITLGYGRVEIDDIWRTEGDDDFKVDISFSKNLNHRFKNTTGLLNLGYLRYVSDIETLSTGGGLTSQLFQKNDSDILQFSTGFLKDITEIYTVYCQLGASYTFTSEEVRFRQTLSGTDIVLGDVSTPEVDDNRLGGVFNVGVNYDGLYYDMGLSLSQDMRGASGTNGVVQRSSVAGNISGKITDKFSLTLNASCYLNQNERKAQPDTDDFTLNIQPGFRYKITNDFTLSGVYRFTSVENRENSTTSERNMIYFVLRKEFEL